MALGARDLRYEARKEKPSVQSVSSRAFSGLAHSTKRKNGEVKRFRSNQFVSVRTQPSTKIETSDLEFDRWVPNWNSPRTKTLHLRPTKHLSRSLSIRRSVWVSARSELQFETELVTFWLNLCWDRSITGTALSNFYGGWCNLDFFKKSKVRYIEFLFFQKIQVWYTEFGCYQWNQS